MAAASAALRRTASGGAKADRGTVRITASEMIGCEVLPPIISRFRDSHPGITIELALNNRNEDLLRRDADIAVRMVRPRQKSLLARHIGKSPVGLYAHRSYAEKYGAPRDIAELSRHCIIGFDRDDLPLRSLRPLPRPLSRDLFGFRCDSDLAQFAALKAAVGIGGCQHNIARRYPELLGVLAKTVRFDLEVWLAMHEDMRSPPVSGSCSINSRQDFRTSSAAGLREAAGKQIHAPVRLNVRSRRTSRPVFPPIQALTVEDYIS